MWDLVGNLEDRFSHNEAHIITGLKDLNSTVAKRGSVFIGLMTSDGAIWFRYQRVIIISLQEVIKRPLKGNIPVI